jgi:hypothetical protein
VFDDTSEDGGSIGNGWSLSITGNLLAGTISSSPTSRISPLKFPY